MMREAQQAAEFYKSLSEEEREDLAEAVAADIYFFDENMQEKIRKLIESTNMELWKKIAERNNFTL
ncbi:MAG: hypothetical protein GX663_08530 [Clostridiales bacterium]|nr:hypothetical protein [Clostridiales bacterium]